MNKWISLENQVRSWTPRNPSRRIEQELFGGATADPVRNITPSLPALWRWLTPALAACFMLLLVTAQREARLLPLTSGEGDQALAVAALSNQFYAAYLPSSGHSQRNGASQDTRISWTNRGGLFSSMGSFRWVETNQARW